MQDSDKARFLSAMTGLAECFGAEVSKPGLSLRFEALREHSIEAVEQACIAVVKTRKYTTMPTVAELLEHIGGGSTADRAEVEAAKVLRAVSQHGGYASVCFDDPVTQAVIQGGFGGWQRLCSEQMESERNWFIKDFTRMYRAYAGQGVQLHGHLAGICEIDCCAKGMPQRAPQPRLIGDPTKAQLVLEQGRTAEAIEQRESSCLPLETLTAAMQQRRNGDSHWQA